MLYYRTDFLRDAGISEPTTLDQFTDSLKAMLDMDKIPYLPSPMNTTQLMRPSEMFLYAAFGDDLTADYAMDNNGKVHYGALTEQFERYVTYLNELYSENLMYNEVFTFTNDQMRALVLEDEAGYFETGTLFPPDYWGGNDVYEIACLTPLTSQWKNIKESAKPLGFGYGNGLITNKCKYPEAMVRFFDITYADEEVASGTGLYGLSPWLGPENKGFRFTDSSKEYYERITSPDTQLSEAQYTTTYHCPGSGPCRLNTFAVPFNNPSQGMKASESIAKLFPYLVDVFPNSVLRYNEEDTSRVTSLEVDFIDFVITQKARFVTGQQPLSDFPKFRDTLKSMGIDELIQLKQKAYDEFMK